MIKRTAALAGLTLCFAYPVLGQGFGGMSDAQMQQMMQNANKMQQCVENLDQNEMNTLMNKGEAIKVEVSELCKAGKRDAAMSKAVTYGKEVANSSVMKEIQRCGDMMKQFMPEIPMAEQMNANEGDPGYRHICDAL